MNEWQTAVVVVIVAGLFSVVGAVVAATRQHVGWLRQARLDAYTGLVATVNSLTGEQAAELLSMKQIRDLFGSLGDDEQVDTQTILFHWERSLDGIRAGMQAADRLQTANAAVHLLGPDDVAEAATALAEEAALVTVEQADETDNLPALLDEFVARASKVLRGRTLFRRLR